MQLSTPVLFLVFNRPEPTARVFEAIRSARPSRLYIAADGARSSVESDAARCAAVRLLTDQVDWPCDVVRLLRDENLGCLRAVSSAISWFFQHEERGIILEDDCLPSGSFFSFCEQLLGRYSDDARVWQVCGTAYVAESFRAKRATDYVFSRYGPIWGWATWRRAWQHYDAQLRAWPQMVEPHSMNSAYPHERERRARIQLGWKLYRGEIDTWDYQWGFTKNLNSGLSVVPLTNLVVNLGFGGDATHTRTLNALAPRTLGELEGAIRHPSLVIADAEHDDLYRNSVGVGARPGLLQRVVGRAARLAKRAITPSLRAAQRLI